MAHSEIFKSPRLYRVKNFGSLYILAFKHLLYDYDIKCNFSSFIVLYFFIFSNKLFIEKNLTAHCYKEF